MLAAIRDFKDFTKQALTRHRLACLCVAYAIILVWYKGYVLALYKLDGGLWTTLMLAMPILLVTIFTYLTKPKEYKASVEKNITPRQLSEHYIFLLTNNTPTSQLDLMNEVLLVSLSLTHGFLSDIKVGESTLFEEKSKRVIRLLKDISAKQELANATVATRSKINAIVMFAFYRLLFSDVMIRAIEQGVVNNDIDPWILLKRIPPKMVRYLGPQSWRVYELKTLIFGDLNSLSLNEDIKWQLQALCEDETKGKSVDVASKEAEEPIQESRLGSNVERQENEAKQVFNVSDDKAQEPELSDDQLNIKLTHALDEVLESLAPSEEEQKNSPDHSAFVNKFKKWLARQVKRHQVNQSERFFVDVTNYGKALLFMSDIALSDFCKKDQLDMSELKQFLVDAEVAAPKKFLLIREGQGDLPLSCVEVDFDIDITQPITGKISEVSL